jgi:DNA-binding beta-propeller fold protein YncE
VNRREFVTLAAAAPFGLRATLSAPLHSAPLHSARLPAALVTCDTEARLAVVDLGSFRITGWIPTLPDPRSIERVGTLAVVCHTAVGALSILDGRGVRHVVRGLEEPRYVAAHPDGRHAFVTDSGRSGVLVLDVVRGRLLGRVGLPGWARHLTIDARGRRLWVGLGSASDHVAVVDTREMRHVGSITPGFGAHDVGHAPDGRLWVTGGDSTQIAVGSSRLHADLAPQHVTFGSAVAYVTSGDSGTLRVVSLDGSVRRTTPVPIGSYNVQYGDGRVITASLSHGTLTVLDRRGALLARIQVAASCHDACFRPG